MAKFIFRLQSVLELKSRLETQQKNAFAAARKRLNEEEEKLNRLYKRLDDYEEEGRRMRTQSLHIQDILSNENAIIRVKEYIDDQTATVRLCESRLEEERKKLVEIMKEKKMYEKLRERALEEYLAEEKRIESVDNDEHNSYVYGVKEA